MHERVDPTILDRQTMKYRIIVVMVAILWVGLTYARHCHIGRSIFQSIRAQGAGELRLAKAAAFDWEVNSGTPCFASSARTPLLTAVGLTLRRLAASVKLRCSATARKRRISSRELMVPVVAFYYELQVY